jgi:hypothetical protein
MTYQGPDPSEAIPVGQEALNPEELGRLIACTFELQEIAREHAPDRVAEEDATPEQLTVIKAVEDLQAGSVDSLKQAIIDNRKQ